MQLHHSAIVVEDLVRSLEFYQALGLTLDSRQVFVFRVDGGQTVSIQI